MITSYTQAFCIIGKKKLAESEVHPMNSNSFTLSPTFTSLQFQRTLCEWTVTTLILQYGTFSAQSDVYLINTFACLKQHRSKEDTHSSLQSKTQDSGFKVCQSMHHRTIQINHQPNATIFQFIILTFIYSSTCFGRFPVHHQELNDCSSSLWFYLRIVVTVVLCSWSGWPASWVLLIMVGPVRTDQNQRHCYHHVPTVNRRWLLQFISSWWWAWGCPKHAELYLNDER